MLTPLAQAGQKCITTTSIEGLWSHQTYDDLGSNWNTVEQISGEVLAVRKKAGQKTTFYVACCIPKPNTFTFSPPAEACYLGWFASARGFDGFLRSPITVGSRIRKWIPGSPNGRAATPIWFARAPKARSASIRRSLPLLPGD